jgi:hypothetical protein
VELDQAVLHVARSAEGQSRRPRLARRHLVAGAALVGVIGLGGAATAGGLIPALTPWTGTQGTTCLFIYAVDPAGAPIPESADIPRPVYDDPATVEANSYLAQYDFDSIDRRAAVDRFADKLRIGRAAMPADQRPPAPDVKSDEFESQAVDMLIQEQLAAHMKATGFDPNSIVFSGYRRCEG